MNSSLPLYWISKLKELQAAGFPEAIIAGGSLRDLDNLNITFVKDVDIFVKYRGVEETPDRLREVFGHFSVKTLIGEASVDYLRSMADVQAVYEVQWPLNHPLQVIALAKLDDPMDVLRRIDFGLCQIGHDGFAPIETGAYVTDRWNKTFTVTRCDNQEQMDRSLERFKRFQAKYPEYELRVPEEFGQFAGVTL